MHLCRSSSNVPRLPSFLDMLQNPYVLPTFDKVHNPLRLPRKTTSERPKVVRTRQFLTLLTSKCASRYNGVHFFHIATSKSGPNLVCFVHFDMDMCFAPQRRALFWHLNSQKWSAHGVFCTFWLRNVLRTTTAGFFRHLNSQKWSEHGVLCTFWLRNVLRATTACTFSTSNFQKWSEPGVLLGNVLRATTACTFSSLIWPAGSAPAALATNHSRLCYLFAHLDLLSSDSFSFFFSSLLRLFPSLLFHLSILSEVWLLNFLRLYLFLRIFIFIFIFAFIFVLYLYLYLYISLSLCAMIIAYSMWKWSSSRSSPSRDVRAKRRKALHGLLAKSACLVTFAPSILERERLPLHKVHIIISTYIYILFQTLAS